MSSPTRATKNGAANALRFLTCATYLPGDPGYDSARTAWNLAADQRPAAVAVPVNVDELAEVLAAARGAGLRVAAQSTGHGASVTRDRSADAVLLRLDRLTGVTVNPNEGTARARGGTVWRDVVDAAAPHGLAGMHGGGSDVGVAGFTLGGGLSWYARTHGLACGAVRAVELILPDGTLVRTDSANEADLFWALRGGGGAYGVVTAVEMDLLPLPKTYAGMMLWDAKHAERVVHAWARWTDTAPESATTVARVMSFPSLAGLPPFLRGRKVVLIEGVILGGHPEEVVAPLRGLQPEIDTFSVMPSSAVADITMDPPGPVPGVGGHVLLDSLPESAVDTLLRVAGPNSGTSLRFAELRHLGGALARPGSGGALNRVDGAYALYCRAISATPTLVERGRRDAADLVDAMTPYGSGRELGNLSETPDGSRCLYPDVLSRLRGIRDAVDPERTLVAGDWLGDPTSAGRC